MHHRLEVIREAVDGHIASADGAGVLASQLERVTSARRAPVVRAAARALNPLKAPTLESRRRLSRYWAETGTSLRRWRLWRINPARLSWNLALDVRNMLVFLAAAVTERY